MSFIVKPATECLERVAGITMVSFLRLMALSFTLSSVKPIVTEGPWDFLFLYAFTWTFNVTGRVD